MRKLTRYLLGVSLSALCWLLCKSVGRAKDGVAYWMVCIKRKSAVRCVLRSFLMFTPKWEGVGLPGFEPRLREPKPLVLPLHHSPIQNQTFYRLRLQRYNKKCKLKSETRKIFVPDSFFLLLLYLFYNFNIFGCVYVCEFRTQRNSNILAFY